MTTRELGASEVYYEVVDRLWPMNALCAMELDEPIGLDRVDRAWTALAAQVPVVGARIERTDGRTAHFDFGAQVPVPPPTRYDDLPTALATESTIRFDLAAGPLVRCAVVGDGTAVLVVAHHTLLDGRGLAQLAFVFAGVLADETAPIDHPLTGGTVALEPYVAPAHSWTGRRTEMLALARQVRDEDGFVGKAAPPPWHDPAPEAERAPGFITFGLTAEESRRVLDWSRSIGATVQGALSAAFLDTLAELAPGAERVGLSTIVDLRAHCEPPADTFIGQAAALMEASYPLGGDPAEAARSVSASVRQRFDRGEAELFLALSGVDRLSVGEASDKTVHRWISGATPSATISNLGLLSGTAPDSLTQVTFALAPTPNQAIFVAASTYRGRMSFSVSFDRNRLSVAPEAFVELYRRHLDTLTSPQR